MLEISDTTGKLPRALLNDIGEFDLEILNEAISTRRAPGKQIRELFQVISSTRLAPTSDAVLHLGRTLFDSDFRRRWAIAYDQNNRLLPPLSQLLLGWCASKLPQEAPHPREVPGLLKKSFRTINHKVSVFLYPHERTAELFLKRLQLTRDSDEQIAAIYYWAFLEEISNNSKILPHEKTLSSLVEDFNKQTSYPPFDWLREALVPCEPIQVGVQNDEPVIVPSSSLEERQLEKHFHTNRTPQNFPNEDFERVNAAITTWRIAYRELLKTINFVRLQVNALDTKSDVAAFAQLTDCAKSLELKQRGHNEAQKELSLKISSIVQRGATQLGAIVFDEGIQEAVLRWDPSSPIYPELELLRENLKELHELDTEENAIGYFRPNPVNIASLTEFFEATASYISRARLAERSSKSIAILKSKLVENAFNLDWTFNPSAIGFVDWSAIASRQLAAGHLTALTWIAIRSGDEADIIQIQEYIQKIDGHGDIHKIIDFFSHLSFDQIEKIGRSSAHFRSLAQLALFSGFVNSQVLGAGNDYRTWSFYPLNDIAPAKNNTSVDRFLHFTYLLFAGDSEFNSIRLRRLLTLSLLNDFRKSSSKTKSNTQELSKWNNYNLVNSTVSESIVGDFLARWSKGIDELTYVDVCELLCPLSTRAWVKNWIRQQEVPHRKNESQRQRIEDGYTERVDHVRAACVERMTSSAENLIGEISDDEQNFLNFLIDASESTKKDLGLVFDWVINPSAGAPKRYVVLQHDEPTDSGFQNGVVVNEPSPMWPRVALSMNQSESKNVNLITLATDMLFAELEVYSPVEVAQIYSEQKLQSDYLALLAQDREAIPPDVERDIEQRFEKLARDFEDKLILLKNDVEELPEARGMVSLTELIAKAETHLVASQFRQFEGAIDSAKQLLDNAIAESKMRGELLKWSELLVDLGSKASETDSLASIKRKCENLLRETHAQRHHLLLLEKLKSLSLPSATSTALSLAYSSLRKVANLPRLEHSEFVNYLFGEIFNPLCEQLRRSQNFLPAYRKELDELTEKILLSLSLNGSLANPESDQLKILEKYSSNISSIADLDIQGVAGLRENITKGLAHLLPSRDPEPINIADEPGETESSETMSEQTVELEDFVQLLGSDISIIRTDKDEEQLLQRWLQKGGEHDAASNEQLAAVVALASRLSDSNTIVRRLTVKNVKGTAWEIPAIFLIKLASAEQPTPTQRSVGESIEYLASKVGFASASQDLGKLAFGACTVRNPSAIKWLWDHFSGGARQAECRASLLVYLAQCGLTEGVAYCLGANPIDFNLKKAKAIALAAVQAYRFRDKKIIETFNSLRRTGSKPFQLFADAVSTLLPAQSQTTVLISIVGELQSLPLKKDLYETVIKIVPNTNDWAQSVKIKIPPLVPLRAVDGTSVISFDGPFVEEQMVPIHVRITDTQASNFVARVLCSAVSISGALSNFDVDLSVSISGTPPFEKASTAEIERAFSSFPAQHMRGEDYIPRAEDERRIERALVLSNTVRSLWISSPRRSGKTTMLYRILDQYSHKVGRDNAVIYLTIDRTFTGTQEFNEWVWKRVISSNANFELKASFPSLVAAGSDLPYDADVGTFFAHISEIFLSSKNPVKCSRVIFLIDEVDRFAAMHFDGGVKRDAAWNVIWQIRELIGQRKNIGFVFAGSSAAKRIFVTSPDSPLFNYITLLELAPFSCKDKVAEQYSRMVIEPTALRSRFHYPRESLEHLIWICAGIPYYMKLLSGATLASACQRHILKSAVNDALDSLLRKKTGIVELDEIGGDPGADELRTMALENDKDKILARAVLYTVAEMLSPVSGLRLLRGRIAADDSPLVARYKLNRKDIDRGIEVALELGIVALTSDDYPEVYFPIPILGESLRVSRGRNWATIDHQLSEIGG